IVDHVTPPFTECRMAPLSPTTQPDFSLGNVTAFRFAFDPEGRTVQVFPPEFVNRIRPRSPTAQPCELSMKKILARSSRPPSVRRCHDSPPSSLRTMRP